MRSHGFLRVAGGLIAAGLVVALAAAPQSAAITVEPQASVAAGSLDLSFAGGAGYRVVPNPSTVRSGQRSGLGVLVTPTGAIRTIASYPTEGECAGRCYTLLMRGWTASGWVDRSFYSGGAKSWLNGDTDGDELDAVGMAADSTISMAWTTWDGTLYTRLQANGHPLARHQWTWDGSPGAPRGVSFLPSGAPVLCWAMGDRSTRLQLFDAGLKPIGFRDGAPLPGTCYYLARVGSHLWYMGSGSAGAPGQYRLGIARTDLALNPDPAWSQDGYAQVQLPFYPHIGSGIGSAVIGLPDGGAYVYSASSGGGVAHMAKFTPAGDLDASFGALGVVRLGGASGLLSNRQVRVRAVVADGKGVVASIQVRDLAGKESWRSRLIRVTPRGAMDPRFGQGGVVSTSQTVTGLAQDTRGRILTLSTVSSGSVYLARRLS